jgi:outer membrane protein assembly factor BamB
MPRDSFALESRRSGRERTARQQILTRSRGRKTRRLRFESLEERRLLAVWAGQHGDMGNTGRADYAVPSERLNDTFFDVFSWQTRTPSPGNLSSTSMAFYEGAGPGATDIVVGGYHWPKGVQGMNRHTGEVFWFGNPDGGESIGVNTPAFSNDGSVVYVTNDATSHPIMAFPTETGPSSYWDNGNDANPTLVGAFSPKVAPDGRVFVHAWDDRPYGLTDSGTALTTTWAAQTDLHSALTDPALYQDGAELRVVSSGRAGLIKSYDGASGSELWSVSTGYGTDADVTVDPANGNIYVPMGFADIVVAGLDKNGNPLWTSTIRPVFDWVDGVNNPQRAQSGGALSQDGGTFYFQTDSEAGDGRLYAISTADGSIKWSFDTHSQAGELNSACSPIVTANGVIVVGNNLGDTYYALQDLGTHAAQLDTLVVDAAGAAMAPATMSPDGRLYLPLRIVQTVGGGGVPPSFQVENLFTAIDITANPQVVLPAPANQSGIALNHAVALSWGAIQDPGSYFSHYAVYRDTVPFDSVDGMIPLATLAQVAATSYTDGTANNGTSYYYAVTTVSTTGNEVKDISALGPRTPRDETDLQVVSIARTPEFPRFNAQYASYEVTEPSGFGPYVFSASTGLGGGQTISDPRFPQLGEPVVYTATVRNRGTNLYNGNLSATWMLDGAVVGSPTQLVSLDPGEVVTFQYDLPWDFNPHDLTFSILVADSRAANNWLTSDPLAAPFLTYIDRSFVEDFREVYTTNSATQNDDIIDWLNSHMRRFNELFEEAGSQKRVHYGVLQVIDDRAPLPVVDISPYAIFPLRYGADDGNPRLSGYYQPTDDIDYGLLHEMGHQLGLIDLYQLDIAPETNLVSGQGYQAVDGLMRGVSPFLSDFSALAMEHWLRESHGYYGQYMYNLPDTMQLRILGYDGQPLEGATVKVYQLTEQPGVGKVIANQVKFQGTTNSEGLYTLPNVPIDSALVPTIGTGDQLQDNPFGYVAVVGTNGVFHIRVEYDGFVDYAWLDITEANVAYWHGETDVAVFDRQVSLGGPIQRVPPVDMAEGNAGDWEAWAQGATATISNDTMRKIVGNSSLKFVTDGGFDTYARYPGTSNALWDLRGSDVLTMSIYAENNTIGFQGGSPWIRLYDADGNYFQFQFYSGGNPYDLLNEARNAWQTYHIPLDANEAVQDGWHRTSHGTPDLSAIAALEIHSDTWDYGFTLWIDGVAFEPQPRLPGDANGDGTVNIFDINLVSAHWGQSGPLGDVNYDGAVDIFDINAISANWGLTLPTFGGGGGSSFAVDPSPAEAVPMGGHPADGTTAAGIPAAATELRTASVEGAAVAGDVNLDGRVDALDVETVSANWRTPGPACDANGDGVVNIFDVNWISANWTQTTVSAASTGPVHATASDAPAAYSKVRLAENRVSSAADDHLAVTETTWIVPTASNRWFDPTFGIRWTEQAYRMTRAVDANFGNGDLDHLSTVALKDVATALVGFSRGPVQNRSTRSKS